MQERIKRLGLNTIFVFIGKAGSSIIGLLMLPFYTHWLSTDEYGTTDLITTYSSILMGLLSCCVADAIFVFPKNADKKGRTRYYTSGYIFVAIMTCIVIAIMALLEVFGLNISWAGVLFEKIWFVIAFAVCQFLQQYSQCFTRSIDKMHVFSISGIVYTGAIALFSFFILPRYGLNGYLFSMLLAMLVATVYTVIASGSYRYISIHGYDKSSLVELLKYGLPLIPNSLMWWIVNGINRPIMEANLGLDALGIYAVANKFPLLLSTLVSIFGTAWGITMLEEFGKPDFNQFFNKTLRMLYFIMIVGACVIASCSKLIIYIFADPAYFEAWKYIPILTLGIILQNFSGTIGGVFMAEKTSKYFFYSSIWGAAASLVATISCIKLMGLQGAAIAIAFSFLVMSVARLIFAWKHINEMRIGWYVVMTLLYIFFCIVVLQDASLYINVPLYIAILAVVCIFSKNEIVPVLDTIKDKFVKK